MEFQIRDFIQHLSAFPPDSRLQILVQCANGSLAEAAHYEMKRSEHGVCQLRVTGALVRQIVQDEQCPP